MADLVATGERIVALLEELCELAEEELGLSDATDWELEHDPPEPWTPDDPIITSLLAVRRACGWVTLRSGRTDAAAPREDDDA